MKLHGKTTIANRIEGMQQFVGQGKLLLLFLALALILAGCGSGDSKQVIKIRVRSNRVVAQSPQNRFNAQVFAPTPIPSPTPKPLPTRPEPVETEEVAAEEVAEEKRPTQPAYDPPTPTPQPLVVPVGHPDRIVIPSLAVDSAVRNVESIPSQIGNRWFENWQTVSHAAGFHNSSALLGQAGNTVISGHNNIDGSVFQDLYQLQPGEIVQLYADGYRYDYIVEEQFILREEGVPLEQRVQNASWIRSTIDERITLVSCWPPTGNEFRVIVVAKPLYQMVGDGATSTN